MSLSRSLTNDIDPENSQKEQVLSDEYKQEVFVIWYNRQKPTAQTLMGFLPDDKYTGDRASIFTLRKWISHEFTLKASELDSKISAEMDQTMVQEKVEMLKEHIQVAKTMQNMALEYLQEHGVGNARNAITMLVKGIEIEHNARSLPKFMAEMSKKTDEELIEEIRKLAQGDGVIDIDSEDVDD